MSRFPLPALILGSIAASLFAADASGQAPTVPPRGPEAVAAIGEANNKAGRPEPEGLAPPGILRAMARYEGTASPGLKVTLDGSASTGGRTWYRWLQTQGPIAKIDDPTRPEAHFIVPTEATKTLGFVLVVGDRTGVDAKALTIEVEDPAVGVEPDALKADAGDDQSARVGRKVVLNGVRSEPRGILSFRWLQLSGPKAALRATDSATCAFIPTAAGTYKFALIVASPGGTMSEPSTVTIEVSGQGGARASAEPEDRSSMAIDELARASIASIEGGPRYADDLSRVFDVVADRVDTYKTFADVSNEMGKSLDSVIPRDKDRRAVWADKLFKPLMARFAAGLKAEGLDLTATDGPGQRLTSAQRSRLAEQFRYTAAGLRDARVRR